MAAAIRIESKGPVFYISIRVAKSGRETRSLRFRILCVDNSEQLGLSAYRVTRIGHALRKSGLDELPRLFSVLNGNDTLPAIKNNLMNILRNSRPDH